MAADASRSPSPVAAPPIPATPGPRAAKLIRTYNDAVSHTLKTCNYSNFAACFPTPAKNEPAALQELHKDFVERLESHCKTEFEAILRERNVVASLNDLDRLIEEARQRRATALEESGGAVKAPEPPHTLPARSLYMAHLGGVVQSQQAQLKAHMEQVVGQNEELFKAILKQRQELEQTAASVEAVIADIDASLQVLPANEIQTLSSDAVALDAELCKGD